MSTFVVPAADIDATGLDFNAALPVAWLEASLAVEGLHALEEGSVTTRLSRSGRTSIVVRGKVAAKVTLPCARCLDPAAFDVTGELGLLLQQRTPQKPSPKAKAGAAKAGDATKPAAPKPPSRARGSASGKGSAMNLGEYEFSDEEAQEDEYDGENVVLDPFIREAILLELPNFPLCKEDCPGISTAAAAAAPAFTAPHPFEALRFFGREAERDAAPPAEESSSGAAPKKNGKARPTKMSLSHRVVPKMGKSGSKKQQAKKLTNKKPSPAG